MFLDESAFDLEDNDKAYNRRTSATNNCYSKNPGPATNYHDVDNNNDDDDDGARMPSFGSAGGIGTPTSSRARMLAQQRDIQQKKRLSAYQSGGMVRSSINNLPSGTSTPEEPGTTTPKGENQFTPAVRQFSAPKAFRDETSSEQNSEFRLPTARKAVMQVPQTAHNYQLQGTHNRKSSRFSDDEEEEEEDTNRSLRGSPQRSSTGTMGGNGSNSNRKASLEGNRSKYPDSNRNAEFDEDGDDYDLRKGRSKSTPSSTTQRHSRERNDYHDDDDDDDNDEGNYHGSTATTTARSSQNHNSYKSQENNDVRKNYPPGKWEMPNSSKQRLSDREKQAEYERDRDGDRDRDKDRTSRRGSQSSDSARQGSAAFTATPLDLHNMRHFLTTPLPRSAGVVQCYIRRNKSGTNKLFPVYSLFLKDTDQFLMASKKRPNNKTSNYLISMGEGDLTRDGANYLGKLRSNFVGTEFQIFDSGSNPKETEIDEPLSPNKGGNVRTDLGAVMYAANVLGSRGPRKMQVALPSVDELGKGSVRNSSGGEDILTRMRDRSHRDLAYLINKPPKWNDQVGAYVLNFNGRVTMASVKNFQLVDPDDQKAVVLQFGKVSRDEYTMDMQWPITPFQAFAVTLSSFDLKIACD